MGKRDATPRRRSESLEEDGDNHNNEMKEIGGKKLKKVRKKISEKRRH